MYVARINVFSKNVRAYITDIRALVYTDTRGIMMDVYIVLRPRTKIAFGVWKSGRVCVGITNKIYDNRETTTIRRTQITDADNLSITRWVVLFRRI